MSSVYLDNAASSPLDPEVFEVMKPYLISEFGNPSSLHAHGQRARVAIESARKQVAQLVGCSPGEIIFTSGGTEANNALLRGALQTYGYTYVISSPIEHHAVLHSLENTVHEGGITLYYVKLDKKGNVDLDDLKTQLQNHPNSLVSLMHANNEIGNLLNLTEVGQLCKDHKAYFHSDTVQSIGHYHIDFDSLLIDGAVASAHKFHGPKGVGFMYINKHKKIESFIKGGGQERNLRSGTENVSGIVGLAKALEISHAHMTKHRQHIEKLKTHMINSLRERISGIIFFGESDNLKQSLYTVLSVGLPESKANSLLLFHLNLKGVSASGGSACSSGTDVNSHVIQALHPVFKKPGVVRFSFSKYNTEEEIDYTVEKLTEIYRSTA